MVGVVAGDVVAVGGRNEVDAIVVVGVCVVGVAPSRKSQELIKARGRVSDWLSGENPSS